MDFKNAPFQVVRHLDLLNDDLSILGALASLVGNWSSQPGSGTGWNVIAVPLKPGSLDVQGFPIPKGDGFVLEVFPYHETLSFTPVIAAANRGPIVNGKQEVQQIGAVIYEQRIFSDCDTDFCKARGLAKLSSNGTPNLVHAETGMLLNISNFAPADTQYARMGIIPHGNTVLALGSSGPASANIAPDIQPVSITPSLAAGGFLAGYGEIQYQHDQFSGFDQGNPNQQLLNDIKGQTFKSVTQVSLSTQKATGGILNIPFINKNVNANFMNVNYWIERVAGQNGQPDFWQLQYSQTVNLVFPPADAPKLIVNWPHVDINTLRKVN